MVGAAGLTGLNVLARVAKVNQDVLEYVSYPTAARVVTKTTNHVTNRRA